MINHIRSTASALRRKLPRHVDIDDLIGAGCIGYAEVLAKYDSTKSSIATYAAKRIRGAMIDYLRNSTWSHRSKDRMVMEQLDDAMIDVPIDTMDHIESDDMLCVALDALNPPEREFITQYYWYDSTFSDLGQRFGYSKVMAWKTHKRLLAKMRAAIGDVN